jgi:very-short-patch-repair endonuclease
MTRQERALWWKLCEVNRMLGTSFRRQAPVGPYIADFVEFGQRLVIEVDGGGHGGARDMERDAWMKGEGFRLLRVWNADVDGSLEGVMAVILDSLAGCMDGAPPPHPSPTRGEGGAFPATGGSPPPRGEGMGVGVGGASPVEKHSR